MRPRISLPGVCLPAALAAGDAAPSGSAARTSGGNDVAEAHAIRAAARGAPKRGPEH